MTDSNRSTSHWSMTTKSTAASHQTIPLITVRRKLLRQLTNSQKPSIQQRRNKSKHDVEELFKLYYSNDLQFDAFQRQIVTGKRMHTARTSPISPDPFTNSSNDLFDSKICVSREQISPSDMDYHEQKSTNTEPTRAKSSLNHNQSSAITPISLAHPSSSSRKAMSAVPRISETTASTQQNDFCESSFVKSLICFGDVVTEPNQTLNRMNKPCRTKRPSSSISSVCCAPPPSLLLPNNSIEKIATISLSTTNSLRQPHRPSPAPGSSRQRSPVKTSLNIQRTKSSATMTTNSASNQSTSQTSSPTISSPSLFQSDMPELPIFVGAQRVVSIPSRCSRYVLVSFPERPLRYNTPTYVERLLLPERFPHLFRNIVRSYNSRVSSALEQPSTE